MGQEVSFRNSWGYFINSNQRRPRCGRPITIANVSLFFVGEKQVPPPSGGNATVRSSTRRRCRRRTLAPRARGERDRSSTSATHPQLRRVETGHFLPTIALLIGRRERRTPGGRKRAEFEANPEKIFSRPQLTSNRGVRTREARFIFPADPVFGSSCLVRGER